MGTTFVFTVSQGTAARQVSSSVSEGYVTMGMGEITNGREEERLNRVVSLANTNVSPMPSCAVDERTAMHIGTTM